MALLCSETADSKTCRISNKQINSPFIGQMENKMSISYLEDGLDLECPGTAALPMHALQIVVRTETKTSLFRPHLWKQAS